MAAKKKTPTKKKIVRNEERENRMLKLFQMWEHGDQEAYEQLLKIACEDDRELTESDLVHPYDTDNFVSENFFHLENMQQKPFDCILEPGLSLEELNDWKERFLKENAFYPPTEFLALLHFCNGCEYNGKHILGFGVKPSYLNVMKRNSWETPSLSKAPALEIAMRRSFDEGVYFYVYMPVERVYGVFFKDGSDLQFFQDSWEIYASLWEALEDMGRDD